MMKKKHLAVLLMIALVLTLFTGCHGSRGLDQFQVPEDFDTSRNYQITFWAKNDTNMTQVKIYHKAIADFEKLYPNIDVKLKLYTDYGRIYNDVITNISTNTTPNVCITYPDHIATYMTGANTVVPLDNLFADEKYGLGGSKIKFDSVKKEEIVPKFLEECSFDGQHYALPYMRSTEACYVNKTYVEKLGFEMPEKLTWDFVWKVSEAATKKDSNGKYKVNGQKVMIPFIYKSTDNMMIQLLKQKGAGYSTEAGEIQIFNETTEELVYEIASHAKTGAFSTFKISSYPANFLNAGQCIFAVDSTAGATWMGSDAPLIDIAEENLVNFEMEVMEIPQFDTENPQMISQGPSVCVFNKEDPQEVMASWLFTQFLLTNDVQISYAQTEGYVPVTSKAQETDRYQTYLSKKGTDGDMHYWAKIEASELLIDNVSNTFTTPVFNGSTSLRDAAGQIIENTVKSVNRKQTVDDAFVDKLFKEVTSLYRLNQGSLLTDSITAGKADLGPLPKTAVALLATLAVVWTLIIGYFIRNYLKNKKLKK